MTCQQKLVKIYKETLQCPESEAEGSFTEEENFQEIGGQILVQHWPEQTIIMNPTHSPTAKPSLTHSEITTFF